MVPKWSKSIIVHYKWWKERLDNSKLNILEKTQYGVISRFHHDGTVIDI